MDKEQLIKQLKEYKYIMPRVQELNKEVNQFKSLKDYCTVKAQVITDMPVCHSVDGDKIGDLVARYDKELQSYIDEINQLLDKRKEIDKYFNLLDHVEKQVITARYINNPEHHVRDIWEFVGYQCNYHRSQAHNIHNKSIDKILKWCNS